jgi:hypothetical protein
MLKLCVWLCIVKRCDTLDWCVLEVLDYGVLLLYASCLLYDTNNIDWAIHIEADEKTWDSRSFFYSFAYRT